jgi:hypothetical protein
VAIARREARKHEMMRNGIGMEESGFAKKDLSFAIKEDSRLRKRRDEIIVKRASFQIFRRKMPQRRTITRRPNIS